MVNYYSDTVHGSIHAIVTMDNNSLLVEIVLDFKIKLGFSI